MTFRMGQGIVCVDARGGAPCLRQDQVFTCLGIDPEGFVRVECCPRRVEQDHAWFAYRFRPLGRRQADISIFTAMLTKREMV